MWKRRCFLAFSALWGTTTAWGDAQLTEQESRWLAAAAPVVTYARQQLLPIDIIVQPQDTPGHAPVSMGFMNGRCKLVLSMRGNPSADATADSIPAPIFTAVAEAIAAHEVAHCWRYAHGAWNTLSSGFIDTTADRFEDKQFAQQVQGMRETRREEGYADLVGLAWTQDRHPEHYAQVHDWFTRIRDHQPVPGDHHDTRTWVRLAKNPSVFTAASTPFEQVVAAWQQGLAQDGD